MDRFGSESQPQGGEGPRLADASRGGTSIREAVGAAGERIQEIIDAAERLADDVRREAETEAQRYLAERRREADRLIAERTQRLEAALAALRERFARIDAEGQRIIAELERVIGPAGEAGEGGEEPGGAGVADDQPRDPPPASHPAAGALREAALIRATQMAVGGSSRAEIDAAFRRELGLADPGPLLDEVFRDQP